ncbi:MAG: hypothetical protein K6D93_08370 [Saccharofermentans sp.]|nr:hypothetical protein [Saccharofermentans sp.]
MKIKRLLAFSLSMVMMVSTVPALVFADETDSETTETSIVETSEPKEMKEIEKKKPSETEADKSEEKKPAETKETDPSQTETTESAESTMEETSEPAETEPVQTSKSDAEVPATIDVPEEGRKEESHAVPPKNEQESATEITSAAIRLDAPVKGAKPDYTAAFLKRDPYYSSDYSSGPFRNDIRWKDITSDVYIYPDSDVFQVEHKYRVEVLVTAKEGYKFTGNTKATLNGYSASASVTASGKLYVSYDFELVLTEITSLEIKLDAPVKGAKPDYTAIFPKSAQYYAKEYDELPSRNNIRWHDKTNNTDLDPDSSVFEVGHEYTVYIRLFAKDGYIFTNNTKGTLNGNKVTVDAFGPVIISVYYTFEKVLDEIPSVSVTFDAPVACAKPDYTAVLPSGANYYVQTQSTNKYVRNGIKWIDISTSTDLDPDSAVFTYGHLYEVVFYLSAKGDNFFSGNTIAIINGQNATANCYMGYLEVCYTFQTSTSLNTLKVTPKTAKVKYKKLKKKKQTVVRTKVMNVSNAQGNVIYKLTGVKRGKSKKYKKYFKINATTGNVTIKKKLKKGTYKVTCVVTAAGDTTYLKGTKTVTFKIKVK